MALSYKRRLGNRVKSTEKKQRYYNTFYIMSSIMNAAHWFKGDDPIFLYISEGLKIERGMMDK